jgi:hypothetical protein
MLVPPTLVPPTLVSPTLAKPAAAHLAAPPVFAMNLPARAPLSTVSRAFAAAATYDTITAIFASGGASA